jgi:hypothetical protein
MGLKSAPTLAIGSTKSKVSNIEFDYRIAGADYTCDANAVGTTPGNDVVPEDHYGAVAFDVGTDEVVDVVEAAANETGYDTGALAVAGLPAVALSHMRAGYITVIKTDGDFTFGDTLLDASNTTVVYKDGNVNYPSDDAGLELGTNETKVNPDNWNVFVDNLNELISDLILANGDGAVFPGTDHTAGQSICMDDAMQAIRHQIGHALGETNWYDAPGGSLKAHTHAVGQGGLIAWSSLGVSNARKIEIHPNYPGGLITTSLRGASPSGQNNITINVDVNVVSYIGRHYYEGISSQTSLQDYYVALRFTLPIDFEAWTSTNAIQIEYRTGSALSSDCHVDIYVYKSGGGSVVASSENNVNINWSNIGISGSSLGEWDPNDIIEIYVKLESRNNNYARIGKICFNYTS